MAQTLITTERIGVALDAFRAMLGDVAEIADTWDTTEENERISLTFDWIQQVGVVELLLDPALRSNQMTRQQQEDYRQALRDLTAATPHLKRIDWQVPDTTGV